MVRSEDRHKRRTDVNRHSPAESSGRSLVRLLAPLGSHRWVRFALLFGLLIWPWDELGRLYALDVSELSRALLIPQQSPIRIGFEPDDCATGPSDADIAYGAWHLPVCLADTTTQKFVRTSLDLRRGGYIALAVFLSLTFATRLRAAHKLRLLGIGVPLLHLLPMLPLLSFASGKLSVSLFHFGPGTRWFVETAYHALVASPGMIFAVPLLLWLFLTWWCDPDEPRAWVHGYARLKAAADSS